MITVWSSIAVSLTQLSHTIQLKLVPYLITVHDVYMGYIVYVLLLSRMSLMVFHRCGVVGVSSPGDRRLGGKSRENLFFNTGLSEVEECRLLFLLLGAELSSPSSKKKE